MSKECCTTGEHTKPVSPVPQNNLQHDHEGHDHSHDHSDQTVFQLFLPAGISFILPAVAPGGFFCARNASVIGINGSENHMMVELRTKVLFFQSVER